MPDTEHVAQVHVEGEASRLSPPRGVQGLCRKLEPGTVRKQPKELCIKEIAGQAPGSGLSLMDNEREQADRGPDGAEHGHLAVSCQLRGGPALWLLYVSPAKSLQARELARWHR